jgi:hypothetical protein
VNRSFVVQAEDLKPHGMMCCLCPTDFSVGDEAVNILTGMIQDTPLVMTVCPTCGEAPDVLEKLEALP